MGQSRRFSVRANPSVRNGALVTISARVPKPIKTLFEERVAELVAAGDPGVQNQTDALQDAIVKWLLLEGK